MNMALPPSAQAVSGEPDAAARNRAMTALMGGLAMATLDMAAVSTGLPSIARYFGSGPETVIFVMSAYQAAMVATLVPLAALGDRIGHRPVYLFGLIMFVLGVALSSMAWSQTALILARALQGLGGAGIMSVSIALVRAVYPARLLGRGMGINALVVSSFLCVGPLVAAFLLEVANWRWLFLVNLPVGLAVIVAAWRTLPAPVPGTHRFDIVSALVCMAAFALVALVAGRTVAQWQTVALTLAGAAVFFAILIRRDAGKPAPLLALDLFRRPIFRLSAITGALTFGVQGVGLIVLPFLVTHTYHFSASETGLVLALWPAFMALSAPLAGPLSDRIPPAILGSAGLLVLAAGMICLATAPEHADAIAIGWRVALCGLGFGFFQSPNLRALMHSTPAGRSGAASGVVAISRLIGQLTGAGITAACFALSADGAAMALWAGAVLALLGLVASTLRLFAPEA